MILAKHLLLICLYACLPLFAGCGAAVLTGGNINGRPVSNLREVALNEEFKLEKDEKVAVRETNMTVQLKGVRRTWYVDGKSETVDADIILTLDGKEQRQWMNFKDEVRIGDYAVELKGAYPFGKSSASLIVRRV